MKLLWICNSLLPEAAKQLDIKTSKPESWISGTYNFLKQREDIELIYLFPSKIQLASIKIGNTKFVSYTEKRLLRFEKTQVVELEKIIKASNPDIIHIFGTEYPHTLAAVKAAKNLGMLGKTIINIQGLCSVIAKHYFSGLDSKTIHSYTFRDLLRHNNIYNQMLDFKHRGKYETEALKLTKNVIGRTDWDEACTKRINPNINYHFCNESLRKPFYENHWDIEECERHSIFVSQCSYTIKGFHFMLEAMADIIKKYPDAKLYTTGKNPLTLSFKQKLRQGYYNKYLGKLIKKYHLENNVEFLGFLNEEKMCKQYLNSHVFVCCSSVENSPNSLGEAMILGVPSVSSDVGGVKNLMEHGKEGFVYQSDAPYMLSFYIQKIFENDNLALKFSKNARLHASKTHNAQENFDRLMEIYKEVLE